MEYAASDFGDQRLNKGMVKIADQLGKNCNRSIRMASGGRAEMEAAYRFMDNPKVTPEKIPSPHRQSTLDRVGQRNVALLVHDTTELDLTRLSHQAHGGGPLSHDSRFGSYLHPLVAFTAEGLA
ncbi:MAG TPA: transposase DNA-binding-containing protein [Pirellulaceae bacterium]|nr:transposase DNA-binding-containing protein [Pirellulaceae bacterium]HMO90753.1 transposase DNA-binding-containing protein [Pirellulaceae bacterium]